jgi:3-oxoacyl-[acyl-carrier-protein] synthase-3
MAEGPIQRVRVAGIASAVPDQLADPAGPVEAFGAEEVEKILSSTGTRRRRLARETKPRMCVSDLCVAAASRLLQDLAWDRESVGAVVLVTQTPDYRLPATACVVSARLGLPKTCAALDVNLGCSGYVYGLWLAGSLIASGAVRRALVMVGDMLPLFLSPQDRATRLLFGDAGAVTALEFSEDAAPMWFTLGTDGRGYKSLVIPAGASRIPSDEQTRIRKEAENGNIRGPEDLFMDGSEVFTFTLREVPGMIKSVLLQANWTEQDVDAFVFHQANLFMLRHLAKRMRIPLEKVALSLGEYGNTSSASIPLTINHCLGSQVGSEAMNLILAGFGVGLSWAAVALSCGPIVTPPVIEVGPSAIMEYGQEIGR